VRPVNTVLLKLAKRAESYDRQHLIDSFVDVGPLFTLLSNQDNQILFGRRGTGKTHVLGFLANEVQKKGGNSCPVGHEIYWLYWRYLL
jgi:DNA replication protein DnaC